MRPRHVVGPLHRLRGMIVSNVFVLDGGPGDRFVVDTGHRLERAALIAGLRRLPFSPRELTGVLLTHHHSDHAGNAAFLRASLGIPVLAHRADAELLEGRARAPLLAAVPPLTIVQRMCLPHPDYAVDRGEALASLRRFHASGHRYENLLAGHGRPILGGARTRAEALLERA